VFSSPFRPSEKEFRLGENGVNFGVALRFTLAQAREFSLVRDPFSPKQANICSS